MAKTKNKKINPHHTPLCDDDGGIRVDLQSGHVDFAKWS
jgi:hypothetical protein